MRQTFGLKAGLPVALKGRPRLSMARATASNNRRASKPIELEFFTSQVWKVPAGVRSISKLIGMGGAGQPGATGTLYAQYRIVYVTYDSPEYGQSGSETTYMGDVYSDPGYYCETPVYYPGEHATLQYCYEFVAKSIYYPPTNGANTTGFGKTWGGGIGGPASSAEYLGVPVTAGDEVSLIIPVGGYIKIAFRGR